MIKITNKSDCCGCTACASVCAHHAISMEPDAMGFLYPKVDTDKCTECGLCEKVCAFNESYSKTHIDIEPKCFAARLKDVDNLRYSRSGGAFIALSNEILKRGGVIYGVGYKEHYVVVHKRAISRDERDEFRGSKYVQSDLRGIFSMIKKDLKEGKTVLFTGTPCQTAGLSSYIRGNLRSNLILVDIICHAVPSPAIWKDYLNAIEKKFNSKVIKLEFRDKTIGWNQPHLERFIFENGKEHKDFLFRYLFYNSWSTRPSCNKCHYTNLKRPSDITIGDFWGYEKVVPDMNKDNKGISIIICNTSKGYQLFNESTPELTVKSVDVKDALQFNLCSPTPSNPDQAQFIDDYKRKGFLYVAKKYGSWGIRYKINVLLNKIKNKIKL